jgi:glycosyltransferase involved in cell wall biosynthesis
MTVKVSDHSNGPSQVKPMTLDPLPERPLVSILMSNYNYGAFLGDGIESCLCQTHDKLEVIICDDGSIDCSPRILERYRSLDRRIKVVYQAHGGQSLALNAAFRQSTGDIICLLDADDVFMPDKVQRVIGGFAAAPDAGFVVNRMSRVDRTRKYLGDVPLISPLASGWMRPFLSLSAPHMPSGLPPCSGLSLRRSVAEAIFPLPGRLTAYADTLIQVLAPLITPIVAIETPLSEYRVHGANLAAVHEFDEIRLRNLAVCEREIWHAWRRFLASPNSGLPANFPLPPKMPTSPMSYAYSRFRSRSRSPADRQAISWEYFRTWPRAFQWYWRAASLMPNWLFRRSFAFIYGQTRAKVVLGKILSAYRKGLRLCQQLAPTRPDTPPSRLL